MASNNGTASLPFRIPEPESFKNPQYRAKAVAAFVENPDKIPTAERAYCFYRMATLGKLVDSDGNSVVKVTKEGNLHLASLAAGINGYLGGRNFPTFTGKDRGPLWDWLGWAAYIPETPGQGPQVDAAAVAKSLSDI